MATVLSSHGIPSDQQQPAAPSSAPKALWATVGVLAIVASALGGALVMKSMNSDSQPAAAPAQASALPKVAPADGTPEKPVVQQAQPQPQQHAKSEAPTHKPTPAPAKKPTPQPAPAPAQVAQAPIPAPAPAPRVICASCGTVESVHAVQVKGEGTGLGVAGGAVAGGLLGHQMGGGNGKTAMTVIGAVGGALAGNEIEKRARASTAYDVTVRMEDGSVRTVRTNEVVAAGSKVQIENGALRMSSAR